MTSTRNFGAAAILAACSLCAACARAPQTHALSIAAAADLQFALEEASRSFHQAHPATALRDPSVRHVAIANPAHAPYGRAAEAALRAMGLYDSLQAKLVLSENISQAFQFVESGAAD